MNDAVIFDVSKLLDEREGAKENYSFDGPVKLDGVNFKGHLKGRVELMKINEGIHVSIKDIEANIEFFCVKCLKSFMKKINIKQIARLFQFDEPQIVEDRADLFLIDKKHQQVDLSELLRQEIILHFPIISVCSSSCKGLCLICGKDLNKAKCRCKKEEILPENKPLAVLKQLLK